MSPSTCPTQALPEAPWISLSFQDTYFSSVSCYVAAVVRRGLEGTRGMLLFQGQRLPHTSNQQEKTALGPTVESL